ncbi:hypothetical protein TcasGA2_TC001429 [Tribolium castaneum]|uniref:Uncharacterized protein n=2 Tax=Tribolium castaneum TaxID=7070 RepID=A0A139WA94_TRICA|nr:hypothetical protein TcasGA2_TC001429 [Tribolium castaneum]
MFKAPSLALHMGTNLKILCDVALKVVIEKRHLPNLRWEDDREKKTEIKELKKLISGHWCNELSSLALKNLKEKHWEKPTELPLTSDILTLQTFISEQADKAYNNLINEGKTNMRQNYKTLAQCVLALTIMFNRKRVGDVQYLKLATYISADKNSVIEGEQAFMRSLTSVEQILSKRFKRVVTGGKGSKPVPILFSIKLQKIIDCLIKIRTETSIVPTSNPFLFANPGSQDRWMNGSNVMRKLASSCGAKNPNLLTSTRFRKHIATTLQLMSMEDNEMEQVATFMGHTKKTHAEFYRLPQDIYQTAKVAKILLLLEKGKGEQFKGKSLNEIELERDIYYSSESESETDEAIPLAEKVLRKAANAPLQNKEEKKNENAENNTNTVTKQLNLEEEVCSSNMEQEADAEVEDVNGNSKKTENTNKSIGKKKEKENNSEMEVDTNNNRKNAGGKNKPLGKKSESSNSVRHRWSEKEKRIVLHHFRGHILKKVAPKKHECEELISQHNDILGCKSDDNEQGLDEGGNKSPTINIQSVVTFRDGIRVDKTEGKRNDTKEEESVLPNDENQELFLADSELTIYSANEYSNSKVQLSKRKQRHMSEVSIQQLEKMPKGSIERKQFIAMLRKKGNFLSPAQNEIKVVKRPVKEVDPSNILPCVYCKGFYMKRYLKRHVKTCLQRPTTSGAEDFRTADAQSYLAFRSVDQKFIDELRFKEGILNMRCDNIAFIAKSDPLILSFAAFYAKRHRHNHLNKVTKNKIRELARLWKDMKKYINDKNFFAALKPENFKYFVLSTQNITGYNHNSQKFEKAPSLALHMGTTLRKVCEFAFSEIQQKNHIFISGLDILKKTKDIKVLKELIKNNWSAEVSSVANQNLVENQWNKPTIIPLTSDIKKLNNYVKLRAEQCADKLKKQEDDKKSFNDLQKCCFTLLITLNRRRIGELERLELESYLKKNNDLISEEFEQKLTETEKFLLKKYKRIRIRGKRHKPVPVLISKEVQEYINLLLLVRKNFVPENGYAALRWLAQSSGAEYPKTLTSGKLRKHIATISQISDLSSSELEQLCTFLGHTMTTHQDFYRLPQEIYQTAKLTKLLLKSQNESVDVDDMNQELGSDGDNDQSDDDEVINVVPSTSEGIGQNLKEKIITNSINVDKRSEQKSNGKGKSKKASRYNLDENQLKISVMIRKPPTESEIEEFSKKYPIMENKDWKKIKVFVYNEYSKK